MTKEQFERWKDFALRMAEHAYPRATEARKKKRVEEVADYFYWRELQNDWPEIGDWDYNNCGYHPCSEVDEFFDKYRHWNEKIGWYDENRFHNQITSCIRAAFDFAVKQSGGVIGFTAGDIRRCWDGNVPEWIKEAGWEVPFDTIPDNDQVWM
jgi:hypothetical protein